MFDQVLKLFDSNSLMKPERRKEIFEAALRNPQSGEAVSSAQYKTDRGELIVARTPDGEIVLAITLKNNSQRRELFQFDAQGVFVAAGATKVELIRHQGLDFHVNVPDPDHGLAQADSVRLIAQIKEANRLPVIRAS